MLSLSQKYQKEIVPSLMKKLNLGNRLSVPQVKKVVVNVGIGEAVAEESVIDKVSDVLTAITGQKPRVAKSRQAISGFKLRKGVPIGLVVTLRRERMFHFLEKLFKIVLPRLRDFKGLPVAGFDGRGNYSLGLTEQTVFYEVDYDKIDKIRGLEITIVTNAGSDGTAKMLLEELGMPFEKGKVKKAVRSNYGQ
ncbi:MAG TPA: 50S ribosomal protein L5 [Candidatus Bathyarchaeia archaeon]|nr:50S ribosomal protein L5 [Candidatus Bathyarchaeia archaeon]